MSHWIHIWVILTHGIILHGQYRSTYTTSWINPQDISTHIISNIPHRRQSPGYPIHPNIFLYIYPAQVLPYIPSIQWYEEGPTMMLLEEAAATVVERRIAAV